MKLKITLLICLQALFLYHTNAQCDGADFEEINGIAVFEIESINLGSGWNKETGVSGFTGDSFVAWRGSNNFNSPGAGATSYKVKINSPGVYRFQWRNKVGIGTNSTEHNDSWLRFPDAYDFFAQKGTSIKYPRGGKFIKSNTITNGSSANGWMKAYLSGTSGWTWTTFTSDNDTHKIYAEFTSPGVYTIQISGRSNGHFIDRMVLYKESSYSESSATNTSRNETSCGSSDPGPTTFTVPTLRLINADTDQTIGTLVNNSQIDLDVIGDANISVNAFTDPGNAGSVRLELSGPTSTTRTDNAAPFTLFGTSGSDFSGRKFPVGSYTLTATPYEGANLSGTAGTTRTINFTVVGGGTPTSFTATVPTLRLINADTDKTIGTLVNNSQINLDVVNDANLSVNAFTDPATVGSVRLALSGPTSTTRTDNAAPYTLFNTSGSNFSGSQLAPGAYTLTVTPYENSNLGGTQGTARTINFTVVGGSSGSGNFTATVPTLRLINADTDNTIGTLVNNSQINLDVVNDANLSVNAFTDPATVGSVRLALSGPTSTTRTDNAAPYTLFSSSGSNFSGSQLAPGAYTLTVTPYENSNLGGTQGTTRTINFTVVGGSSGNFTATVPTLRLINADTDNTIGTLVNNSQINLDVVNNANLSVNAFTDPATVGSVRLALSGPISTTRTDNAAPYTLFDASGSNFSGSQLPVGSYTLTVTPYENSNLGGTQGTARTINFTVVGSGTSGSVNLGFNLIDASTDKVVIPLRNGNVLTSRYQSNVNITATTDSEVGSIQFTLSGARSASRTENDPPYALFGNIGDNFTAGSLPAGEYTITAEAYSGRSLTGTRLETLSINFRVLSSSSSQIADTPSDAISAKAVAYPNPSPDGRFKVQLSEQVQNQSSTVNYSIVNASGAIIQSGQLNNVRQADELSFDISSAQGGNLPGIYYLILQDSNSKQTIPLIRR